MTNNHVDLRSDTVTRPTPAMRRAMGMAGRKKAERLLSTELFVNRYDDLLRQVLADRRPSSEEPRA